MHPASRTSVRDPRLWQVGSQALLFAWGLAFLGFRVPPAQIAATLGAALATQWLCDRAFRTGATFALARWRIPFEPRSALISAMSLLLLLRVSHWAWAAVAAGVAVASKFAFRVNGKHVWNPTCLALVVMVAIPMVLHLPAVAWISGGQWGNAALAAFTFACLGTLVIARTRRADITPAFLGAWALLLFARAAWLGQPPASPLHQFTNGAVALFAFFMISDPRTTPDSRAGRIVFAALVALGAGIVQFALWRPNGLLWSLALLAPLVPVLDRLLPGERHTWSPAARTDAPGAPPSGGPHASAPAPRLAPAAHRPRFARA